MTNREFIKKLKRAMSNVKAGRVPCGMSKYTCHHCALTGVGIGTLDYKLEGYRGKKDEWSFNKSKDEVLALFDNSIKALEAK